MSQDVLGPRETEVDANVVDANTSLGRGPSVAGCLVEGEPFGALVVEEQSVSTFKFVKDMSLRSFDSLGQCTLG